MTIFLIVHNINYYEKIKKYYEDDARLERELGPTFDPSMSAVVSHS